MENAAWKHKEIRTQTRPQPWVVPGSAQGWYTSPPGLPDLAARFAPISLKEMDAVALLDRTDTKFVMPLDKLLSALAAVRTDYRMLVVNGRRLNHYRTLYFDTAGFELYNLHVNGRAERYKVRSREYTDTGLSFLEVKHKTRTDRTIKDRVRTSQPVVQMDPAAEAWLTGVYPYDSRALEPKLWNTFTRITLVSRRCCERVTLDVDLTFYNADRVTHLDGIAIAEVKRSQGSQFSPFLAQMRDLRIQPHGFSKYTLGAAMLYDQVKKNEVKPAMLWLNRLSGGISHE